MDGMLSSIYYELPNRREVQVISLFAFYPLQNEILPKFQGFDIQISMIEFMNLLLLNEKII